MKLSELLIELNSALNIYGLTLSAIKRSCTQKNESETKRKDLEGRLTYCENQIERICAKIDEYFDDGYFSKISKEESEKISDEYIELLNNLDYIRFMMNYPSFQKFPKLLNFYHTILIPNFEKLNNNIQVYNSQAIYCNWDFTIIDPEEAKKHYQEMKKLIQEQEIW